jgi:hypothetical protein
MLLLEPKKFLELLRRPNKCQKRPTIRAKETYYVRTFESLTSKLARALGIRLVRLLLAYRRALMAFRCLCVRVCVCVCVCLCVSSQHRNSSTFLVFLCLSFNIYLSQWIRFHEDDPQHRNSSTFPRQTLAHISNTSATHQQHISNTPNFIQKKILRQTFWKVSALVQLPYKITMKRTLQKFYTSPPSCASKALSPVPPCPQRHHCLLQLQPPHAQPQVTQPLLLQPLMIY